MDKKAKEGSNNNLEESRQLVISDLVKAHKEIKRLQDEQVRMVRENVQFSKMIQDQETLMKPINPDVVVRLVSEILPSEVWDVIFEKLSPFDLITCSRTSKAWQDTLKNKRTTYLFHEVFPLITKHLNNSDNLGCRRVSHTWRDCVNNYFQQLDPLSIFDDEFYFKRCEKKIHRSATLLIRRLYRFTNSRKLQKFVKATASAPHTLGHNLNPFISKCVTFIDSGNDKEGCFDFWIYIIETFLPRFGSYIESCQFQFITGHVSDYLVHKVLVVALKYLQNVNTLYIQTSGIDGDLNHDLGCRLMQKLNLGPGETEIPVLNSLTTLHVFRIKENLLQELLFPSVVHVKMKQVNSKTALSFPCDLEELHIDLHLSTPKPLQLGQSPLKVLSIDGKISLEDVIQAVNPFRSTVKVLKVSITSSSKAAMYRLVLPLLEILEIETKRCDLPSIDFLIPLVSLQKLFIKLPEHKYVGAGGPPISVEVIKFRGCHSRMYESNIWELLPNLHTIVFSKAVSGCERREECEKLFKYTRIIWMRKVSNSKLV